MASCPYTDRFIPIEQLRNKADDLKKPPKAMSPSSISMADKDQGQVFHDSAVTVYQSSSPGTFLCITVRDVSMFKPGVFERFRRVSVLSEQLIHRISTF